MKVKFCLSTEKRISVEEERLWEDYNDLIECIQFLENLDASKDSPEMLERYNNIIKTKKDTLKMLEKEIPDGRK